MEGPRGDGLVERVERSGEHLQQLGNVHAREGRTTEALEASIRARSLFESIGEDMRVEEISAQLEELGAENGRPLSGASATDMTGLDM